MEEGNNGSKVGKALLRSLVPVVACTFIVGVLIAGMLGGGGGNVLPADEDTQIDYQMLGGQLGVNWQWVMLIDMYNADAEGEAGLLKQNPVWTALNCLQITIDVYYYDYDPVLETGGWRQEGTDYANGAEEILNYFDLPMDTRDVNLVVNTIAAKNSDKYHIKTEPYGSLEEVLSSYYSFSDKTAAEIIKLEEENYLAQVYGDTDFNEPGGGIFEGEFGELPTVGMQIPLYYQYQSPWGQIKFGDGNIASSGCSITSLAMVLSYLKGTTITPAELASWAGNRYHVAGQGQSWGIFPAAASKWSIHCTSLGNSMNNVLAALEDEKPVIARVGKGTFTKKGHFIVLRGITADGKILVNDPNDSSSKRHFYRSFDVGLIKREATQYWSFN